MKTSVRVPRYIIRHEGLMNLIESWLIGIEKPPLHFTRGGFPVHGSVYCPVRTVVGHESWTLPDASSDFAAK